MTDPKQLPSGLWIVENEPKPQETIMGYPVVISDKIPKFVPKFGPPPIPDWLKCVLCGKEAVGHASLAQCFPQVVVDGKRWHVNNWVCKCGIKTLECPECLAVPWKTRHDNGGPWAKCPACGCGGEFT